MKWYQLDPFCEYGGELIEAYSYDDFVKELNDITYNLEKYYDW